MYTNTKIKNIILKKTYNVYLITLFFLFTSGSILAQEWTTIKDVTTLHSLFDDTKQTTQITNKSIARAIYKKDGTGTLYAWNETFKRQWKVEDNMLEILSKRSQYS